MFLVTLEGFEQNQNLVLMMVKNINSLKFLLSDFNAFF